MSCLARAPVAVVGVVAVALTGGGGALAPVPAAADPHQWIDDQVTFPIDTAFAGGHLAIEKRAMIYLSGYLYTALTAVYRSARGPERRTLLAEGPTMCSDVRVDGRTLVVEMCVERFGDAREVVVWRFDPATGRFVAGRPRVRSPYAEQARAIVADLRAGREPRARAALDRLGDTPDGHGSITWWWSAQRLVADWPAISRARPAEARRRLVPHLRRLLESDDAGEPSLRVALEADLSRVPRTGSGRVGGPRRLRPIVTRAIARLRAGDADQAALAAAATAAMRASP